MKKLIILFSIYYLVSVTYCDESGGSIQQQVAASEVRKVRVPSGTSSSHLNSVGSDPNSGLIKLQQEQISHRLPQSQQQPQQPQQPPQQPHHAQQPQHQQQQIISPQQQQQHHYQQLQQPRIPHPTLDYSSLPPPQSSIFTHQQSGQQPQQPLGGYYVAVNTQGNGAQPPNGSPQQPIYMQYIPQTPGQPANGLQYVQLLAPRTVLYNPYLQTLPQQFLQQPGQHPHHQSAQPSNYGPIQPSPAVSQTYQTPFTPIQQPIGSYSSHAPVAQAYYAPPNRFHQVNGPADLSLNTMEYVPVKIPHPRSIKAPRP